MLLDYRLINLAVVMDEKNKDGEFGDDKEERID